MADERRLSCVVARYGRVELLLLDELGCVQLDARGAELLFQILIEREEKSSVVVASNLPFSTRHSPHLRDSAADRTLRAAMFPEKAW